MATELWTAITSHNDIMAAVADGLAADAYSAGGDVIDNGADKFRFAVMELMIDYASAPTDKQAIDLYMIPAPDGTNYVDGGSAIRPSTFQWVGAFQVRAVSTAQRLLTARFELLPCKVKFMVHNRTSQALPSTTDIVFNLHKFNRQL